jgi:PHD/YefM family antitoxin component YafN of YafNO toxin-antitoxin module
MEKIISVTDLVRNAASIAREVEAEGTVYRITRGGRGSMVLVDEEYFNGWMAALDEMRRPDWREVHDQTSRDIAAGRGRNLDTVAKELGLEGRSHAGRRGSARRIARPRRKKGQLESTYNEAEHPATIPAPPHTAAPCPRRYDAGGSFALRSWRAERACSTY